MPCPDLLFVGVPDAALVPAFAHAARGVVDALFMRTEAGNLADAMQAGCTCMRQIEA